MHELEKSSALHNKQVLEEGLSFAGLTAKDDQLVRFHEVVPTGNNWRSKLDHGPTTEFLEKAVPHLLAAELEKYGLTIVDDTGAKRLVANKGLREEESIRVLMIILVGGR